MGGGLAISTVTVRLEAGSNQHCLAPVVVRRERSGGVVDVEDGCRSRRRWSVCWELTMVGVAGNDGRRSQKWGAFRGESIPCQCPCHVTSSLNVAGASSAVNAAAALAAGQLGLEMAAQGTAALWLAAARLQWRRPAWALAGESKPLTPPSSSSTHAATRTSLQFIQQFDDFTSPPLPKRRSILFLVT